jgi:hypothetical protein
MATEIPHNWGTAAKQEIARIGPMHARIAPATPALRATASLASDHASAMTDMSFGAVRQATNSFGRPIFLLNCGFAGQALDGLSPASEEIPVQNLFPTSFAFSLNSSCHPENTGYLGERASGQSSSRRSCWLDQHFTHHG